MIILLGATKLLIKHVWKCEIVFVDLWEHYMKEYKDFEILYTDDQFIYAKVTEITERFWFWYTTETLYIYTKPGETVWKDLNSFKKLVAFCNALALSLDKYCPCPDTLGYA